MQHQLKHYNNIKQQHGIGKQHHTTLSNKTKHDEKNLEGSWGFLKTTAAGF